MLPGTDPSHIWKYLWPKRGLDAIVMLEKEATVKSAEETITISSSFCYIKWFAPSHLKEIVKEGSK